MAVCRWLSNFDAAPGFTEQSFITIKNHLNSPQANQYRLSALTLDEMEIKKQLEIDRGTGKITGYVDIGLGALDDDNQPQATKVLMLIGVGINGHWKLPLGYWLTDGSTGELQQSIITNALRRLHEVGNVAVSVTADGHPCNIKCFENLGASLKPNSIRSYFLHPCDANIKVAVFLDACHMIKLIRNLLFEYKMINIPSRGFVKWKHITDLQNLQVVEGLTLANRLSESHVHYTTQKMKVKLAVQLLSASVAKALQFLRLQKYALFLETEPTEYFLSVIDRLFDILNSRSPMASGYKKPISVKNSAGICKFLTDTKCFLLSLEDSKGVKLILTKRRTCIIGLVGDIDSVLLMYNQLILQECNHIQLSYLLTYKCSQDHVELIFGLIRRRGGNNNNPTSLQFRRTYRAILSHIGVLPSQSANVTPVDSTELIGVTLRKEQKVQVPVSECNAVLTLDPSDLLLEVEEIDDVFEADSECNVHDLPFLSEYSENIACYIAGYIVRKLLKRLNCEDCRNQLFVSAVSDKRSHMYTFLSLKNNGGLIIPSDAVVSVVLLAERCIREICAINNSTLSFVNVTVNLEQRVLSDFNVSKLFNKQHMQDTLDGIDNHVFSLIRHIVRCYVNVRKFHAVKCWNVKTKGKIVRHMLTKTVLFKNQ